MDFCLLSKFDDLFSDIFLDAQFLWFDTIKLNNDHRRPRIRSDKVLKIIQDHVLATGKTNDAVKELLKMDYLKHYLATKSTKQQQEFIQHMKRYLYMYMPNAGFEIADTRRYGGAGRRVEACVSVTKDWKMGDEMRLCTGMIAHLEPHQEHELKKGNRDISVMWSTRKQCNCLFLGPARFVNHDCEPNAKFISLGPNSVTFKIIKDIKCGDELTAYYGKHYFGENNCECRCATCETRLTGYFASEHDDEGSTMDNDDVSTNRRSSRKRKSMVLDGNLSQNKRSSLDIPRMRQIDLEELIGMVGSENDMNDTTLDKDRQQDSNHNGPLIKQEPQEDIPAAATARMVPIKQERIGDDDEERPKVMSIHFLCNENSNNDNNKNERLHEENYSPSSSRSSSFSHSHSPLDLLCNAVLDAEYLKVQPKQEEITVVVNPKIHRDATTRVMHRNDPYISQHHHHHQDHEHKWHSMDEDNNTTKADSAVGFSPDQGIYYQKSKTPPPLSPSTTHDKNTTSPTTSQSTSTSTAKRKSSTQWQLGKNADDDLASLFDDDEQLSELDDFMDDVSDLSSVCSSDSALDSDTSSGDEDDEIRTSSNNNTNNNNNSAPTPSNKDQHAPIIPSDASSSAPVLNDNNNNNSNTNSSSADGNKVGLDCVVCGRALKLETVSDPSAVDVAVANELATWTWSPSAAFTDWRPQRCPRCERHVRVFQQEWPARKIQKHAPSLFTAASSEGGGGNNNNNKKADTLIMSTPSRKKTTTQKKNNNKMKKQLLDKKSRQPTTVKRPFLHSPPTPTSEIFDGMEDLF